MQRSGMHHCMVVLALDISCNLNKPDLPDTKSMRHTWMVLPKDESVYSRLFMPMTRVCTMLRDSATTFSFSDTACRQTVTH